MIGSAIDRVANENSIIFDAQLPSRYCRSVPTSGSPNTRDLFAFLDALRHQVVALVCGGLLTAALAVTQGFGWQVKPSLYGLVLGVFFLIASFSSWFEQRRIADELRNRYKLVLQIEQMIGPIEFEHTTTAEGMVGVALVVRVSNLGSPTSLTGWCAALVSAGTVWPLKPSILMRDLEVGTTLQYGPMDDLLQKTAEALVPQGSIMHGVVLCLTTDRIDEALKAGATIRLKCFDVANSSYEAEITLTSPSATPRFFPRLGHSKSESTEQHGSSGHGPSERITVDLDASFLIGIANSDDHTSSEVRRLAEPYLGKWMNVSGPVADVGKTKMALSNYTSRHAGLYELVLEFDPTWTERLALLQKGSNVSVVGEITSVTKMGLHLTRCELL